MKRFTYCEKVEIPKDYIKDVRELRRFIIGQMHVSISETDTYKLWNYVSDCFCAGWLDIDFCPDGDTREEFIFNMMQRCGNFSYID